MSVVLLVVLSLEARADATHLPKEVANALHAARSASLYSLEPWAEPGDTAPKLHGFKILGKATISGDDYLTAVREFESSVSRGENAMAACFDPRHALRVRSGRHSYDLLLCYACHLLYIYRDGKILASLGAGGSGKALNLLLTTKRVQISTSYNEEAEAEREKQAALSERRWHDSMPKSISQLWAGSLQHERASNMPLIRGALSEEYPDTEDRILALLSWYGSGAGPWSGFPSYEIVAEELLLDYPTEALVAPLERDGLTQSQTEGAARLFGGWTFSHRRSGELDKLPATLKRKLLEHSLKSTDPDKLGRAKRAFAPS